MSSVVSIVPDVSKVAIVNGSQYSRGMPKYDDPDKLSAKQAMEVLGIRSRPVFYKLVRRKLIMPHYEDFASHAWYSRQQVQKLADQERARREAEQAEGAPAE